MKKPNKTQRVYLNHVSGVWFFLLLCLSGSLQASSSTAEDHLVDDQSSALVLEFFNDSELSNIANRCSGTYLSDNRVLTAAHCFNPHAQQFVRVKCSGRQWQRARLSAVKRHTEMDVAIAQFSEIDCDAVQIQPSLPSIEQQVYVYKNGGRQAMTVKSIDAFTFKVSDAKNCLIRGDSGMMAYADRFAAKQNSALGILISGQTTCPAIQTFLRFDLINLWLSEEGIL